MRLRPTRICCSSTHPSNSEVRFRWARCGGEEEVRAIGRSRHALKCALLHLVAFVIFLILSTLLDGCK